MTINIYTDKQDYKINEHGSPNNRDVNSESTYETAPASNSSLVDNASLTPNNTNTNTSASANTSTTANTSATANTSTTTKDSATANAIANKSASYSNAFTDPLKQI
jgi:hypothetical protein